MKEETHHLSRVNTWVYEPSAFRITSQLATRAHVLAGPAQYRTDDRLARIKFSAGRGIIHNAQDDNLVLTIAKGKRQKRCALLQVWVGFSRELDQRFCPKYLAGHRTAGARV